MDTKTESFLKSLENKKIALCGIGRSNLPLIGLFVKYGADVIACDKRTEEQLGELAAENIRAVADLVDYKESTGPFVVPAKIYVDGFVDVGAVGDYQISVNLAR